MDKPSKPSGPAKVLDGKQLAESVASTLTKKVENLSKKFGRAPGLGVILVGDNPASKTYVASKHRYAKLCGLETFDENLPGTSTTQDVLAVINRYNKDKRIDGILLQLPVPKQIDSAACIRAIIPEKDADGLHPFNQGLLMTGMKGPRSCTPLGVMRLLDLALTGSDQPADLSGKSAIVIGRSQLVGKPMALLLLERNATVTVAHSKTRDLAGETRKADIVVAAVGVPKLVKGDWIKPGALVLDVGINRGDDGKLVGDVDFKTASEVASAITPVPGGVGPMTVSMLIENTVSNFERLMQ